MVIFLGRYNGFQAGLASSSMYCSQFCLPPTFWEYSFNYSGKGLGNTQFKDGADVTGASHMQSVTRAESSFLRWEKERGTSLRINSKLAILKEVYHFLSSISGALWSYLTIYFNFRSLSQSFLKILFQSMMYYFAIYDILFLQNLEMLQAFIKNLVTLMFINEFILASCHKHLFNVYYIENTVGH